MTDLPGFEYDRQAWGGAGPFVAPVHLLTLHTTEGDSIAGAIGALHGAHAESHVVTEIRAAYGRRKVQLVDASMSAKALRHVGDPETNRDGNLQIELVGFASNPTGYTEADWLWYGSDVIAPMCHEGGIPIIAPLAFHPYPPPGTSLGNEPWRTCPFNNISGIVGHEHWVENSHGDPGDYSTRFYRNGTASVLDLIFEGAGAVHPVIPPLDPPHWPGRLLREGDIGPDVELFKMMVAGTKYGQGLDFSPGRRNVFDHVLTVAVEHLQHDCEVDGHLPVHPDGIVGPQTWQWVRAILIFLHASGR